MRLSTAILLICGAFCSTTAAQDLGDLTTVDKWKKVAHGVWSAELGEASGEVRYSDLAGAPPKIERLNRLKNIPLPGRIRKIGYHVNSDQKLMVRIPTSVGEKIFGYGLQFDGTQKNGKILTLKVDHFSKGGGATHAPVPFFISSQGYGVFFNTAKFLKVYNQVGNRKDSKTNPPEVDRNPPDDEPQSGRWMAQPPGDAIEAYVHGKGMELVVFTGTDLQDIVARYNLYCGGGAMPPLWGLGFWHRVPSKFSAAQTVQEINDFRKHDIPLDVIGLEPGWQTKSYPCTFEWQRKRFPDPGGFTKKLLDDGLHLNLWENPYISQHARIYEKMYPLSGSHLVWLGIVPDYTLQEARDILIEQHKQDHFDIGVSGYKIDEVDGYDHWLWPDHAVFPSGTSSESMRQTYGLLMQRMFYKELYHKHNLRTFGLVRASNGAASHYPFAIYSDSYGHDEYITGISSASLSGILWCPEIRSAGSDREWINRMHTVCFSPLAMLNAWASGTKPWSFPDSTGAVRNTIQLRMQLLPYLYTAFADYHQNGVPPVRSMLLETGRTNSRQVGREREINGENAPYADGDEPEIKEDNSLFMFGPDILVAPFYNRSVERQVQLPKGNWYDFYSGQLVGNHEEIKVTAQQTNDLPPLFVKEGSLIPMLKKPVNRTREIIGTDLEIRYYGKTDATCSLYEDDGETFGFEKGLYNLRKFSVEMQTDGTLRFSQTMIHEECRPMFGTATLKPMAR